MNKLKAKVERSTSKMVGDNKDKEMYILWIEGKSYSGFGKIPAKQGDEIEFEYDTVEKDNKVYRNVKKIEGIIEGPKSIDAIGVSARLKRLTELMRCAVDVCLSRGTIENKQMWEQFERFVRAVGEEMPKDNYLL